MGTETLVATSVVSKAGVQGTDGANLTSLGTDDTNYVLATDNNTNSEIRVGFDSPSGNLTAAATQTVTAIVRQFDEGQTGTPTCVVEVWETGGGAAIASSASTNVNTGDNSISVTFTDADTTDDTGASLEVRIVGTKSGGSPGARNSVNFDYLKWDVDFTAAAVVGTVAQASETDSAQAVSALTPVVASVAQATETDSAQAVSALTPITASVSQASETDSAQSVSASVLVTAAVGQAVETATALAVAAITPITVAITQAVETGTALAVAALTALTVSVGAAAETDTAQAVTASSSVTVSVGQASETNTANAVTAITPITVVVGQSSETDTAQVVTPSVGAGAAGSYQFQDGVDYVFQDGVGYDFQAGTTTDPYWYDVHALAKFEDGDASTTVADEKDGTWTMHGALSEVTTDQAKFGTGSFLSNSNNAALRLTNPPALGTGDFTIEFWGSPVQAHQSFGRVFQNVDGDIYCGISLTVASTAENANLVFYSSSDGSSHNVNAGTNILTAPTSDQFYHFCFMRASGTLYTFVDGVQKTSDAYAGSFLGGSEWCWGGQTVGTSRNAGYAIDEVRVTPGVARYTTSGFTVPTAEFPVGPAFWSPADTTTQLWLDGKDASTITYGTGTYVDQWDDKSGNARHASQTTQSYRPDYDADTGSVVFDGANDRMALASQPFTGTSSRFVIGVIETDTTASQECFYSHTTTGTGGGSYWDLGHEPSAVYIRVSGNDFYTPNPSLATKNMLSFQYISGQNSNTQEVYHDGTALSRAGGSSVASLNTGTGTARIGWASTQGSNNFFDGRIYELIILDTDVDTATRQKFEGYLAWKWGLEANLPSGHPYEFGAPEAEVGAITVAVVAAAETDSAQIVTPVTVSTVIVAVGQAAETDTANPVSFPISVGQAAEADSAQPVAAVDLVAVGLASETDTAISVVPRLLQRVQIGAAQETNTALALALITGTWTRYNLYFEEHLDPIKRRGKVVLNRALEAGEHIEIQRYTPRFTAYEAIAQTPFEVEQLEYALDKICFIQQELEGHLCACPAYPELPVVPEAPPEIPCEEYSCSSYKDFLTNDASTTLYWPADPATNTPADQQLTEVIAGKHLTTGSFDTHFSLRGSAHYDAPCTSDSWYQEGELGTTGMQYQDFPDVYTDTFYQSIVWLHNANGAQFDYMIEHFHEWHVTPNQSPNRFQVTGRLVAYDRSGPGIDLDAGLACNFFVDQSTTFSDVIPRDGEAHVLSYKLDLPPEVMPIGAEYTITMTCYVDWVEVGTLSNTFTNDVYQRTFNPTSFGGRILMWNGAKGYFSDVSCNNASFDVAAARDAWVRNKSDYLDPGCACQDYECTAYTDAITATGAWGHWPLNDTVVAPFDGKTLANTIDPTKEIRIYGEDHVPNNNPLLDEDNCGGGAWQTGITSDYLGWYLFDVPGHTWSMPAGESFAFSCIILERTLALSFVIEFAHQGATGGIKIKQQDYTDIIVQSPGAADLLITDAIPATGPICLAVSQVDAAVGADKLKVYVNWVEVGTVSYTGYDANDWLTALYFRIGATGEYQTSEHVVFWNKTLTDEDVATLRSGFVRNFTTNVVPCVQPGFQYPDEFI